MPLYEYVCRKCGHRLEVIQKFSDKPLKKCPECGGVLEKLVRAWTAENCPSTPSRPRLLDRTCVRRSHDDRRDPPEEGP